VAVEIPFSIEDPSATSDWHCAIGCLSRLISGFVYISGNPQSFVGLDESYMHKEVKYFLLGFLSLYSFPGIRTSESLKQYIALKGLKFDKKAVRAL
jgi:hypothetical protein